ncbi:sulfatase-like hydrolase/transferase [Pontiella sp. NLcol2]|uniref:Sulfatase-like hydrolase/transferase n=2 Tax=Pontiella agarivorans TaxID=3038953 RepID=A0ABU5MY31_9BACT|nr:sulfatase-like hydrolase/transferase [Pontiella agarivorans]
MQKIVMPVFGVVMCSVLASTAGAAVRRPNVIVVMADDISAKEFPVYGADSHYDDVVANTPVIDRLANEGCYLSTVWASTVCMPTRAMLMSGRYAHLTKWWDNGQIGKVARGGGWQLNDSSPLTIGKVAEKAGYRSMWVGKTHVTSGMNFTDFGFDECLFSPGEPGVRGNSPYDHFLNVKNKNFWNYHSFLWWPEIQLAFHPDYPDDPNHWVETEINDYGPDIEMKYIMDFMERAAKQDQPFFVYHTSHLGHQAIDMASPKFNMTWPGTPKITWNPESETYTRHEPKIIPQGPVNTRGTKYIKENITPDKMRNQVEYLDYQLWQYLTKLEELDELENTILIFTADNGSKGWKASVVRQRGVHVPFVVYAPGQPEFVQGEQQVIADLTDVLPTLAEIMGTPLPPQAEYELSGKSLWPYLTKQEQKHRDWIYAFKGPKQLIRSEHLLRDGNGDWWDVSSTPSDLDSYPEITDFEKLSPQQRKEKKMMEQAMAGFAREDIGGAHSFHADPSRKLTEQEKEKMRKKAEKLKAYMESQGHGS